MVKLLLANLLRKARFKDKKIKVKTTTKKNGCFKLGIKSLICSSNFLTYKLFIPSIFLKNYF